MITTIRLWLEPHPDVPQFRQLRWDFTKVSLADVLQLGVHPWASRNHPISLVPAFVHRLNDASSSPPELANAQLCPKVEEPSAAYWSNESRFEVLLRNIQRDLLFVGSMSYLDVLGIAMERLRETWSHGLARRLAEAAYPGFQELRRFLKKKNKKLKLSGYQDLDRYDLSQFLSVTDFEGYDSLLLKEGLPAQNLRDASFVESATDMKNRLRLARSIPEFALSEVRPDKTSSGLAWYCACRGSTVTLRPNIGADTRHREVARQFAKQWRSDRGTLCFQTSIEQVERMVGEDRVQVSFPSLNYGTRLPSQHCVARAVVSGKGLSACSVNPTPTSNTTGEELKRILKFYGVPMTGSKKALQGKVAKLAAERYREHEDELHEHFSKNQYIRTPKDSGCQESFPVLESVFDLRQFLIAMYIARHFRGGAILDATFETDTYSLEELADALLQGRVSVEGCFLPAN